MRGAKDPSFLASSKCTQTIANQRKQGHNEVTRNPSQLVLISTIRYKIASLSQRAMLTSQAFRDYFPSFLSFSLSRLQESYLKDLPCSFSPSGYATALNCLHNHPPPRWWPTEKPPTCISISISSASAHYQSMQLTDLITSCPS